MASAAGNNDGEAYQKTVFVATSLDTRLVTTVSASDTVSDFKKKIMLEHPQCFPVIGNINIRSLKVKQRGVFYHLPDSMLVKSAFGATKRNWFVSVDASSLAEDINIQHFDEHMTGDRIAVPWVTNNSSIDRHDDHVSPSINPRTVPFVDHIISNVDGDSRKDVSRNTKEDGSSDDKRLAINKEKNSKERMCDVGNENLLEDPSRCGISLKKKMKIRRVKSIEKASEENTVLIDDNDKVKNRGISMNNENSSLHKSKNKDLIGGNTRSNNSKKCYDLDQVADVPSSLEGVGKETVVVEKNIRHGMSEKEREIEPVQKAVMENEIPSSSTRTSECERGAIRLTVVDPLNGGSKRRTKRKAAPKEVSSTFLVKKLHNINKDVIDSSQQDVGSNGQDSQADLIDKDKEDGELPPVVTLHERRKKVKKSAGKNKNEALAHADDNFVGDMFSTILDAILDEKNEVLETTLVDDSKKKDEIVKELEISDATKSSRNQAHVKNKEEKSKSKSKDTEGRKKRKKDGEKMASRNDKSVVKQSNNVATSMDVVHVDCVRSDDILMNSETKLLRTEKNVTQVRVEDINDKSEKQNESMDAVKKKKQKKKTKKSTKRSEDELITKHVNDNIFDNVKEGDGSLPNGGREDTQLFHEGLAGKARKQKESSLTGPQDQLSKHQSHVVELESKKSQNVDHHHLLEDTSKDVSVSEVLKVNNKVDIINDGSHEINFMDYFSPGAQLDKIASIDNGKYTEKTKDDSRNDGVISKNDNNNALTDPHIPNIDQINIPRTTTSMHSESSSSSKSFGSSYYNRKSNKQQSVVGPVKKILPDSSTRTPSTKPTPTSLSSSGESASRINSRRNRSSAMTRKEGGGKNSLASQNNLKNMPTAEGLRRSSRLKKAKFTASLQVEDTESQPNIV